MLGFFSFILCVWLFCPHVYFIPIACSEYPEKGIRAPGTGVMDGVSLHEGAENRTQVLLKPLSLLSSPQCIIALSCQKVLFGSLL